MGPNRLKRMDDREDELAKRLGFDTKNDGFANSFWENMTDQEFEDMLKNDKKLSNADKNWLRDKRNFDNINNKQGNEQRLRNLQQERQNILTSLKNDVKAIKDNLDDALKVK